jgi:mannose-6-phosphate isomerase-like protein (cupin superfamily)
MRLTFLALVLLQFVRSPPPVDAQQSPDAATDIYAEQVQSVLENMIGVTIDRQLKVADIGGSENVAVGILHRTGEHDTDGEPRGLIHAYITEVYVVLSGGGTLLTGGELFNQGELSEGSIAIGPSFDAESRGGVIREIGEGDIVVIPAGLMHTWTSIPDHVTYLSIRVDPDQVLPTGYVNPEIQ